MRTRMLVFFLLGCFVVLAAWIVQGPKSAQADEIPEKYRDTLSKGLEYLVKHQHKDGHWEGDDGKHPAAMTGLVGLALWMERQNVSAKLPVYKLKYAAEINKAVDWLLAKSRPERDGLIFSEHPSETGRYMQGHGLATLFLAAVHNTETDDARRRHMRAVLTRALKYIVKAQSSAGGWYHTSKAEGHDLDVPLVTVIQVQALQAEANHDFVNPVVVADAVVRDAQKYLKAAVDRREKAGAGLNRQLDTAAALVCRFNGNGGFRMAGEQGNDVLSKKWLEYCQAEIPVGRAVQFGRDELTHYYYAQAVSQLGGEQWSKYRAAVFDHLQSTQKKDGSWPAPVPAEEGIGAGPVYAAALWCTILQLDRGNHPSVPHLEILESR